MHAFSIPTYVPVKLILTFSWSCLNYYVPLFWTWNMISANLLYISIYMHQYASLISYNIYSEIFNTGCPEKISMLCHLFMCQWVLKQVRIRGGGPGGPGPPPDPRFWGPKIEHFWALFNFSIIFFFASLRSAYYFFNMLLIHSSNWKIFQPRFARHVISHLEILVSHILGY